MINSGLGFGWNPDYVNPAQNYAAAKYISIATTHPQLSKPNWANLRQKWYDVLHFTEFSSDKKEQNSVVVDLLSSINKDTYNPKETDWNNTALGWFFARTLEKAFKKAGWNVPNTDPQLSKFGNEIALHCYSKQRSDLKQFFQKDNRPKVFQMPARLSGTGDEGMSTTTKVAIAAGGLVAAWVTLRILMDRWEKQRYG